MAEHRSTALRRIALACASLAWLVYLLAPAPAIADTFDEIRARGTVRIGVSAFVPWTMQNADGELTGFEIDVGRKLGRDMGVTAEFVVYEWEAIIPALQRGEVDLIAAGISVTPGRALQVEFSLPYSESGVTLVANQAATADVEQIEDLNADAVPVVTVAETLSEDVARRVFDAADVQVVATPEEAEAAVLAGEATVYVTSLPEASFLALRHPDVVDVPLAKPLLGAVAAFAVARGDQALLNFLNAWITSRKADLWIDTVHAYWFESLEWVDDVS